MAKLKVFISSTFYDLKHIRSSLENFIDNLGYESVLSEKGSIAYNPDIPLDESCYQEVYACDIFVLIVGGRYGSPASSESVDISDDFFMRYESITKLEYENAIKKDIPVYILIEKSVYFEYETFKRNRENISIKYAHVDSVNVFALIDRILNQPRNNPIYQFEKHNDIEAWLKQQWSGLFQELIRKRKSDANISELSKEVKELSNINTTLKRYLEEIVSKSDTVNGSELIEKEEERLSKSRQLANFSELSIVKDIANAAKITEAEFAKVISEASDFKSLAEKMAQLTGESDKGKRLFKYWKDSSTLGGRFNEARKMLGLSDLVF